jgi:hypothetical protein
MKKLIKLVIELIIILWLMIPVFCFGFEVGDEVKLLDSSYAVMVRDGSLICEGGLMAHLSNPFEITKMRSPYNFCGYPETKDGECIIFGENNVKIKSLKDDEVFYTRLRFLRAADKPYNTTIDYSSWWWPPTTTTTSVCPSPDDLHKIDMYGVVTIETEYFNGRHGDDYNEIKYFDTKKEVNYYIKNRSGDFRAFRLAEMEISDKQIMVPKTIKQITP